MGNTGGDTSTGQSTTDQPVQPPSMEQTPKIPPELDKILQCVKSVDDRKQLCAATETLLNYSSSDDKNIKKYLNSLRKLITESDTGLSRTEETSPLTDGQLSSGCVTVVPQSPSGKTPPP
ncbi:uncharacterized protein LOC108882401 isoform X1, partial [Lates japonicus]